MQDQIWSQLNRIFGQDALEWRIVELSEDQQQAKVRPQLKYSIVRDHIDACIGRYKWSQKLRPLEADAIICELSIYDVTKSGIAAYGQQWQDAVTAAYDAVVYAAEGFGILPLADTAETYWVDYDSEISSILFEPVYEIKNKPTTLEPAAPAEPSKPEGQQAIDRLIDRLRQDGLGLEAAKLLVTYGGYGSNPEAARELYSKLRLLLVNPTDEMASA